MIVRQWQGVGDSDRERETVIVRQWQGVGDSDRERDRDRETAREIVIVRQ